MAMITKDSEKENMFLFFGEELFNKSYPGGLRPEQFLKITNITEFFNSLSVFSEAIGASKLEELDMSQLKLHEELPVVMKIDDKEIALGSFVKVKKSETIFS